MSSCSSPKTPLEVSEHFWLGIQTENRALVKKYSLLDSIDESETKESFERVTATTFGKIMMEGDFAEVETKVTVVFDDKNTELTLNTYLEKNNDDWKVNYRKTVRQLAMKQNMAEVLGSIQEMTEEITRQIEETVEEVQEKIVPEIKSKAEEIQKKVIPEIKSKAEEIEEKVIPEIKSKIEQVEKELLEQLPALKNVFDEFLRELGKSLEEWMPDEKGSTKEPEKEAKTQET
jgi:hypothetical protein